MRILLFLFKLLTNLLRLNPVKVLLLIVASSLMFTAYKTKDNKTETKHKLFFYKEDGSNYFKIYDVNGQYQLEYDNEKPKSYSTYSDKALHEVTFIIGSIFSICSFISLILPLFMHDDEDVTWEFDKVFSKSTISLIKCDFEEGKYFYTINGRLLGIEDRKISDPVDKYRIKGISHILSLPKFNTKSKNREDKLKSLGIS